MSIVTLDQAQAQLRIVVSGDLDSNEMQQLIDSAEGHCTAYLDCNVYPDADTFSAAQTAMVPTFQAAYDAWVAAYVAQNIPTPCAWPGQPELTFYNWLEPTQQDAYGCQYWPTISTFTPPVRMQLRQADQVYKDAYHEAERTFQGRVAIGRFGTAFIRAALLLISHFDQNREAVNTITSSAIKLPFGVEELLIPYRRQVGVG